MADKRKKKTKSDKTLDAIDRIKTRAESDKVKAETPLTETGFLEKLKER